MRPALSTVSAVFLVTASMLGSGILTTTGSILQMVHSPNAVLGVWLIAGIHAVLGAYCYGLIAQQIPVHGGEASILGRFFHPSLGEVAGWTSFVVAFAASNAVSALGFGGYLAKAFPAWSDRTSTAAVGAIVLTTCLHSLTGPAGMRIQTAMASLKFLLLGGLAVYGLSRFPEAPGGVPVEIPAAAPFGSAWGPAVMFAMFAYLGWSAAIYSAGETRDARNTVPKAMMRGTVLVMVLYLAVNAVLLRHVPLEMLRGERAVLEVLVRILFGPGAAGVFAGIVAFALLSGIGASAFLGPRVLQTILSGYRGKSEPAQRGDASPVETPLETPVAPPAVPLWMVWVQGALSCAMILSGTFEQILTTTGFLLGIFPMLAVLGLYTRAFQVPAFARWLAAPLFLAGSGLILYLSLLERHTEMLLACGVLLGLVALRTVLHRQFSARPLAG
jgi:APA family basic amino acid/polyamine antiporter